MPDAGTTVADVIVVSFNSRLVRLAQSAAAAVFAPIIKMEIKTRACDTSSAASLQCTLPKSPTEPNARCLSSVIKVSLRQMLPNHLFQVRVVQPSLIYGIFGVFPSNSTRGHLFRGNILKTENLANQNTKAVAPQVHVEGRKTRAGRPTLREFRGVVALSSDESRWPKKLTHRHARGDLSRRDILNLPMPLKIPGESVRVQFSAAYARLERPISSISLLGGFAFDAVTLKRVDTFRENFWIVAHLAVVAVCILLLNRTENLGRTEKLNRTQDGSPAENISATENINVTENLNRAENRDADRPDSRDPSQAHFWFINMLQFAFGGLLSTFLVFYFRSGSLRASWPFFLILGAAFVANENLKAHYARLAFQLSFFFLSLFCFMIYILPVLLHGNRST